MVTIVQHITGLTTAAGSTLSLSKNESWVQFSDKEPVDAAIFERSNAKEAGFKIKMLVTSSLSSLPLQYVSPKKFV